MDRRNVQYALDQIREIKGSSVFYDIHVHPFEVMDGAINYVHSSNCRGLYSSVTAEYSVPGISGLDLRKQKKLTDPCHDKKMWNKMLQLNRRRIYAHSGPKVFSDHMDLSGIDKVVMLPVMAINESSDQQLQLLSDMFADDDRFLSGYCVPNDIPIDEIVGKIKWVVSKHNVKVLKIHPSLQGIDPATTDGKDRIERILAASKEENLKVIIHGGLTPDCKDPDAVAYGAVRNLQQVDWSVTPETVVIAHSGSYEHSLEELSRDVLPTLNCQLSQYPNLVVDTSGLEVDSLSLVFRTIDTDRICFGSDTLYENQWAAMVKMWCALQQSVSTPEDSLIEIASYNPHKHFSGQDEDPQENTEPVEFKC